MNKPRLIKRGEIIQVQRPKPMAGTIQKTVTGVKDWLHTRHQNTKQSARDAFAQLFTQPSCTGC